MQQLLLVFSLQHYQMSSVLKIKTNELVARQYLLTRVATIPYTKFQIFLHC